MQRTRQHAQPRRIAAYWRARATECQVAAALVAEEARGWAEHARGEHGTEWTAQEAANRQARAAEWARLARKHYMEIR